jgi:HlyD family secretion protein
VRLFLLAITLCLALPTGLSAQNNARVISCLGRIEPAGGIVRLSGPTALGAVIMELKVKEGEWVEEGQVIAVLDSYPVSKAEYDALKVELEMAQTQLKREQKLVSRQATAASKIEAMELSVKAAKANLAAASATLNLSLVKAPKKAQIIAIHAQPGERIGVDGIVEIGQTDTMYVVAEVYETDIASVQVGQSASIRSPALTDPVEGRVETVGLKVGRIDVLGMDPIAQADARVVEVDIRLDDAERVKSLTNLQVEVEIRP